MKRIILALLILSLVGCTGKDDVFDREFDEAASNAPCSYSYDPRNGIEQPGSELIDLPEKYTDCNYLRKLVITDYYPTDIVKRMFKMKHTLDIHGKCDSGNFLDSEFQKEGTHYVKIEEKRDYYNKDDFKRYYIEMC